MPYATLIERMHMKRLMKILGFMAATFTTASPASADTRALSCVFAAAPPFLRGMELDFIVRKVDPFWGDPAVELLSEDGWRPFCAAEGQQLTTVNQLAVCKGSFTEGPFETWEELSSNLGELNFESLHSNHTPWTAIISMDIHLDFDNGRGSQVIVDLIVKDTLGHEFLWDVEMFSSCFPH